MQINATNNGSSSAMTSSAQNNGLGKDDFLKLLVGQLRNQNPLNPTGDQEFIQQMAMFSTLEQVTNLAVTGERITDALGTQRAVGLIGRNVTYTTADGTTAQGLVEQVTFGKEGARLTIGGQSGIDPGTVVEVR